MSATPPAPANAFELLAIHLSTLVAAQRERDTVRSVHEEPASFLTRQRRGAGQLAQGAWLDLRKTRRPNPRKLLDVKIGHDEVHPLSATTESSS